MRSWTTFAIFGGFLLILLAYSFLSRSSSNPTVRTAQQFIDAVNRNDAAAVEKYIDPASGKVSKVGNSLLRISFKEANPFDGPFVRNRAVVWGYTELSGIKINKNADPRVLDKSGLAAIELTSGENIFFKRIGNDWKIIYITKEFSIIQ